MEDNTENLTKSPEPLQSLEQVLSKVPDQRAARGIRYELQPLLMIVMLAKLADADTPIAIADWAAGRTEWLREQLRLDWKRMPHQSTFRRLLQKSLSLPELRQQAQEFLASRQSTEQRLCNLDGKTLRGTIASGQSAGTHLLAIQQAETNLVLAQVPVGEKNNEISAAGGLLKALDLKGKIISGDAMHTQRNLSRQIVEAGGDYLWFVKNNQSALCRELVTAFASPSLNPNDAVTVTEHDKGHGRLEIRQLTSSAQVTNTLDWPYAAQGFVLHRARTVCASGKLTEQTVYGITSLQPLEASPTNLLHLTRLHWNIENGLHYRRDVTFKEDRCRQKSAQAAECLAIFNNLAIGLLRWLGWDNLARARRHYGAHLMDALLAIQGPYQ